MTMATKITIVKEIMKDAALISILDSTGLFVGKDLDEWDASEKVIHTLLANRNMTTELLIFNKNTTLIIGLIKWFPKRKILNTSD